MPVRPRRSVLLLAVAAVVALIGLAMAGGGVWLIALGGSWYYALAGIAMLGLAWLLAKGRPSALWLHALLVVATLAWALWEVGLDWWALAPRGDLVFLLGLVLLLPWITRRLVGDATVMVDGKLEPDTALSRGRLALAGSLALALAVGVASWFTDPHDIEGTAAAPSVDAPAGTGDVPPGEWHSYGRTAHGQRFSPLTEITPANVGDLEVAWTYNTGDISEPGDPTETTFQVTPLKIGDRLFLCTPHQNVIALDADTGEEIWRVEPDIQGELALQHLTCRGLAYHATADAPAPAAADADAQPAAGVQIPAADDVPREPLIPNAPEDQVAAVPEVAEDLPETASCPARLFMPTADGRLLA
ncbi:MAG TPA: membrane-bound PQQ-dependent dehydrogenase, glucose/quinate/shikimate family, partial [Methylomirabilota bacterium]|nr:membrane-bound PQQ-dependent dehydrogenase, glucose/quinate/shikimate family [Methylomirabilota bacterium]